MFDWDNYPVEAKVVWEGFLWSPRLYQQLLITFKEQFLQTVRHYAELGEHSRQFAAFLTYAALDQIDGYTNQDFQEAFQALPQAGLREVAQALSQALDGAGEQREEYWRNRIQPFWQHVWPKSRDLVSNGIAESLARICIAARGEFPAAFLAVKDWLRPIEHPHYVVHLLHESGLSKRFPEDVLSFLDVLLVNQPWAPSELNECLTAIVTVESNLEQDYRFQRLVGYARQHGM